MPKRINIIKLISVTFLCLLGSSSYSETEANFTEAFGGTTIEENVFTFPSSANVWGGFANMNTALYPMRFSEAGSITFNGSVANGGSVDVRFRVEYNPYPNVDPAYDTDTITVSGASPTSYTVNIPSQGANTFSSLIMYVVTQDVPVTITDVVVSADEGPFAPTNVSVTFRVDMSAEETHPDGVYLAGGGVFGQDGLLMTDNGSDVWSVTTNLDAYKQVLYKFRNQPSYGTWDGFEDAAGLVAGGCNTGDYDDRFINVAEDDIVLPVVAYGSCTAEPFEAGPAPGADVLAVGDSIDFESEIAIDSFGGVSGSIFNGVLEAYKDVGAETWAGNVVARGSIIYPLTTTDSLMSADVYSTIPATIRMKLENSLDGGQSAEVDSTVGHTGSGWGALTFNFAGTNAIDANFDTLVLFPNFGVVGEGNTYQYDNVTFVGGIIVVDVDPVSFTVTAAGASEVKLHSSGFNWNEDAQVVAVSNGDGTWTATVDPGFVTGVEYKWIVDGVEEDLSTAFRNGECDNDNVVGYSDTWFYRTWAADAGNVTGDIAGACFDPTAGVFSEAFGGTTIGDGGVYTFPTGAEPWAGFANMNTALYPMSFSEGRNYYLQWFCC